MSRNLCVLAARELAIGWRRGREAVPLASGITLSLRPGELAALVGPNGSGKSTLLRSLTGLQEPLSGAVELCGRHLAGLAVEERARLAATVLTDRFDSGWFTVFDIVAFGRYPFTDARNRLSPRDRAFVLDAIESVGLGALADRRCGELSDGERQKALIARAVAQDCPLLVLDEPTAFLDAGARIEAFHLALRLARDQRKAVVVSTHDLDLALRYADSLWLLDREHRFESGAPEDLALGGAVGRAFDGPGLRFDPATSSFRAEEDSPRVFVSIEGEKAAAAWAERVALRLGFGIAGGSEDGPHAADGPAAVIRAEAGPCGPGWRLRVASGERSFESLEGLAAALRELF